MNTDIIVKIKKLLALADSKNENESQVALMKAQALLMKHKLSLKDVEGYEVNVINVIKTATDFTFDYKSKWKGALATLIANNLGCYCYYKTYRKHRIVFLGKDEDVTICCIMYEYALDCINKNSNRIARKLNRQGLSGAGVLGDYALGFIDGLRTKFEEQKEANKEWGLVLVKDEKVVAEYEKLKFSRSISTKHAFSGNSNAYYEGVEEGKKFSISDKVAGESEEPIQIG